MDDTICKDAAADWVWINANKIAVGNEPVVTVTGLIFSPVSNCSYEVFRVNIDTLVENSVEIRPTHPFVFNPGDVFQLRAVSNVINAVVTARFSLIEVQQANYDPDT